MQGTVLYDGTATFEQEPDVPGLSQAKSQMLLERGWNHTGKAEQREVYVGDLMAKLKGSAPKWTEDMGNISTYVFGLRLGRHFRKMRQHTVNPIEVDDI